MSTPVGMPDKCLKLSVLTTPFNLSEWKCRGLERWFRGYKHLLFLQRCLLGFPAPTWWLVTICNSRFRESDAHGVRAHAGKTLTQNTSLEIKTLNLLTLREIFSLFHAYDKMNGKRLAYIHFL